MSDETLSWESVASWIREESEYWVVTVRPDGRPHAVPVWAVFYEGRLFLSTFRGAQKVRNLEHRANALIHLDSGTRVAIIEGTAVDERDPDLLVKVSAAFNEKYSARVGVEYAFARDVSGGFLAVFGIQPQLVRSWLAGTGFEAMTWTFDDGVPVVRDVLAEEDLLSSAPDH